MLAVCVSEKTTLIPSLDARKTANAAIICLRARFLALSGTKGWLQKVSL